MHISTSTFEMVLGSVADVDMCCPCDGRGFNRLVCVRACVCARVRDIMHHINDISVLSLFLYQCPTLVLMQSTHGQINGIVRNQRLP